ncbi:hypothetical protein [Saccharothrix sp. NRRL B-16314]|uniref:hypothetical protein n=1 Tax=Saccharothrix sp. NRRL B-16314 TaxID=1463825 RepID=UPI000ADF69CF|nr:hypothetical protein [Saccharothrix sp. NRRL B-16314]
MASEPSTETGPGIDAVDSVDLGPFAHEHEAELSRRVLGDRAHGLDAVVAAAS